MNDLGLEDADNKQTPATPRTLEDKVRNLLPELTEAERRVGRALLDDYPMVGLETMATFAKRAGTSGPTILRFTRRLGFESYSAFGEVLRREINERLQSPLSRYAARPGADSRQDTRDLVAQAQRRNIEIAERDLPMADFTRAVALLADPQRNLLCIGGRFSSMIAGYFQHYLRELRPGVRMIRDNSAAWADYLLDVRSGDVLIVFDFRRYQRDVLELVKGAVEQQAEVILITDIWHSPIAALAQIVIACPVSIPSTFDSGVTGLAMAEILTAGVVEALDEATGDRISKLEHLRKSYNLGN
jgi:DNA-binding MurR/RpiR family transcriptional regulator